LYLSRDDFLKHTDLPREKVAIPEWGDGAVVLVRALSGAERDEFEASTVVLRGRQEGRDFANLRAKLVAKTVIGADGERLFTDSDAAAIGELSAGVISRIYDVAVRLSGITEQDQEELAGNFAGGGTEGGATNGAGGSLGSAKGSARPKQGSSAR
jgi:hypothetical protein